MLAKPRGPPRPLPRYARTTAVCRSAAGGAATPYSTPETVSPRASPRLPCEVAEAPFAAQAAFVNSRTDPRGSHFKRGVKMWISNVAGPFGKRSWPVWQTGLRAGPFLANGATIAKWGQDDTRYTAPACSQKFQAPCRSCGGGFIRWVSWQVARGAARQPGP